MLAIPAVKVMERMTKTLGQIARNAFTEEFRKPHPEGWSVDDYSWDAAASAVAEECAKACDPSNADNPSDWTEVAQVRAYCATSIRALKTRT